MGFSCHVASPCTSHEILCTFAKNSEIEEEAALPVLHLYATEGILKAREYGMPQQNPPEGCDG